MPIFGATPKACFDLFAGHIRPLLAQIISVEAFTRCDQLGPRATLEFQRPDGHPFPLDTGYGRLFISLSQSLGVARDKSEPRSRQYRLETTTYRYCIQASDDPKTEPEFRWEYDKSVGRDRHCRHHLHLPVCIPLGLNQQVDLKKLHAPTGWVTIEEVLRFLIVDLQYKPPCGDDWPDMLAASERAFYESFTSKRYRPGEGQETD